MKLFRAILVLFFAAFFMSLNAPVLAQDAEEECPYSEPWVPTEEELAAILEAHGKWLVQVVAHVELLEQLEAEEWLDQEGWRDLSIPGRAILCNADLSGDDLSDADLGGADLSDADLSETDLGYAYLGYADLSGANLFRADLGGADLRYADLSDADLSDAYLSDADLRGAYLRSADLSDADLSGADLSDAVLNYADLSGAYLRRADLSGAYLTGAVLWYADLSDADLSGADLSDADLRDADLDGADLSDAELWGVDLSGADLSNAILTNVKLENTRLFGVNLSGVDLSNFDLSNLDLSGVNLSNAKLIKTKLIKTNVHESDFTGVNLEKAQFETIAFPSISGLGNIRNLSTVWFGKGNHSGLVQLQKALEAAGLRELEREATFALEYGKTSYLLYGIHPHDPEFSQKNFLDRNIELGGKFCEQKVADGEITAEGLSHEDNLKDYCIYRTSLWPFFWEQFFDNVEGRFRLVAFDWTTGYGLDSGRALVILFWIFVGMSFIYIFPILRKTNPKKESGIYRVWPKGRLDFPKNEPEIAEDEPTKRLVAKGFNAFWWALYFSLLSATTIGWRELNVGNWISRVQPKEFGLRGRGWVRVASGAQSLLSVYLIAIWALTYFGRPFQ